MPNRWARLPHDNWAIKFGLAMEKSLRVCVKDICDSIAEGSLEPIDEAARRLLLAYDSCAWRRPQASARAEGRWRQRMRTDELSDAASKAAVYESRLSPVRKES